LRLLTWVAAALRLLVLALTLLMLLLALGLLPLRLLLRLLTLGLLTASVVLLRLLLLTLRMIALRPLLVVLPPIRLASDGALLLPLVVLGALARIAVLATAMATPLLALRPAVMSAIRRRNASGPQSCGAKNKDSRQSRTLSCSKGFHDRSSPV
jgi:hypothetical protein